MTSTRFNVGIDNETRNSSRVLRPPGGGHTDIFGSEPLPVKKDSGRNASSILEGTNYTPQSPVKPTAPTQPSNNDEKNETAPPPSTNQRTRVPPGGFSSGLW